MSLIRMLGVWVLCASAVWADERILSFDETVTVQSDGALSFNRRSWVRSTRRDFRGRSLFAVAPSRRPCLSMLGVTA